MSIAVAGVKPPLLGPPNPDISGCLGGSWRFMLYIWSVSPAVPEGGPKPVFCPPVGGIIAGPPKFCCGGPRVIIGVYI